MTTITLQEYLERIEDLIEENQFSDAISHCRNVLETHPRHIDTYRLLAKALLEQHDYDGAADLFQRVLSADPNDFIAHVGLSVIRNEESQTDDALWHLERAFEIEPYNAAIQDELRRHYAQFSDMAVDRIPLTSGALARLYIKGELYQQAVQELRQALQQTQDRVDLEVLLAEALWRNDQRIDAEEVCLNVLQKLPNCILVNAILSEIWLQTGRIGESQKYLQRLQDLTSLDRARLDLDTAVGRAFRTDGAPPLPESIELEYKGDLDVTLAPTVSAKGPSAEWMSEVTFDAEMGEQFEYGRDPEVVHESPSGMHSYDWMADVNDDLTTAEELPVETDWFMDETQAQEASSDWFAEIAGDTPADKAAVDDFNLLFAEDNDLSGAPASDDVDADWYVDQADQALPAEETALPEWLNGLVDEPDTVNIDEESLQLVAGEGWFADDDDETFTPEAAEGIPDWLSGLADDVPTERVPEAEDAFDADQAMEQSTHDSGWLIDPHAEDSWDEGEYSAEDVPDWLQDNIDFGELETPESTAVESESETAVYDDAPDWLRQQTGLLSADEPDDDLDDWFTDMPEAAPEPAKLEAKGSLLTNWLMTDADEEAEEPAADEVAADDEMAAEDDWLAALDEAGWDEQPMSTAAEAPFAAVSLDDLDQTTPDALTSGLDSDWLAEAAGDNMLDEWAESDWLADFAGEATESSVSATEFPAHSLEELDISEEDEIPDWLLPDSPAELGEVEAVTMGDKEKNRQTPPEMPEPEMDDSADFADLEDDWLSALSAEADEPLAAPQSADDLLPAAEEVPDWLSDYTGTAVTPDDEIPSDHSLDVAPDEEALPDWLGEYTVDEGGEDALEQGLPDWLSGSIMDDTVAEQETVDEDDLDIAGEMEEDLEFSAFADDDLADILADATPMVDWLADESVESAADDWLMADDAPPKADETPARSGLTAWLSEEFALSDDMAAAAQKAETTPDAPEISSDELFAADEDGFPDWLSAGSEEITSETEASNLPDWLTDKAASDIPAMMDSEDLFDLDDTERAAESEVEIDVVEEDLTAVGLTALLSSLDDEPSTIGDIETDIAWLADMPDDEDLADISLDVTAEAGLDWLEEEAAAPPKVTKAAEIDIGADAAVSDLDDAISWLEELAAQQETPVDEMPTVAEDLLEEEIAYLSLDKPDDVLDEVVTKFMETAVVDMAEEETPEAEGDSWLDVLMAEEEAAAAAEQAGPPEDDPEAAMAWLEGLAARQGAPLEELPSLHGAAMDEMDEVVDSAQADLEEAMAWMDDLSAAPQEEWPEFDDTLLEAALAGKTVGSARPAETLPPEEEQELAEALNFLEQQAKAEGVLPVVAGGVAKVSDTELAAALDWLEEMVPAAKTAVAPEPWAADLEEDIWLEPEPLDDLLAVDEAPAPARALATEEDEFDVLDMPDDPDAALVWLQTMAGDDGDIEFDMEPPPITPSEDAAFAVAYDEPDSITAEDLSDAWDEDEDLLAVETGILAGGDATDVPDIDLDEMPDDPDAAMEWLMATARDNAAIDFDIEPPIAPSEAAAFAVDDDDLADTAAAPEVDDLLAVWPEDEMPDDPDAAMEWLLSMTEDEAEVEFDMEPPPITPSEDAAFAVDYGEPSAAAPEAELLADDLDTAVADDESWLEDMLGGDGEIEFDMEPPPITPSEDAAFAVDYGEPSAAPPEAELLADDLDTAVADGESWLEDMLGGDDEIEFDMEPPPITPSEDAAFAVDYGEPSAAAPEAELLADDLDTAVADDESWLEDMLGGDEEIEFDMEPPPITPSEDAAFAVDYGEPSAAPPEAELLADDLDTTVADDESWLEDMLGGDDEIEFDMEPPPITPSEDAAFAVDYGGDVAAAEDMAFVPAETASEEDMIAAVPEDPDEAMAWLEKMAAEQSVSLEDEFGTPRAPDDSPLPAWMQTESTETTLSETPTEDISPSAADATLDFIEDLGVDIEDDLSDSLPDWFSVGSHESHLTGQTGWLRSLEDIDVGSWLTAEEEATVTGFDEDMMLPETGDIRPSAVPTTDPLPTLKMDEPDMPTESYELEPVAADIDASQLSYARTALADKKYKEAALHYQQLIASGTSTLGLIAELETLADENPRESAFRRLLGDAYMRNGQLQKALNTYRMALDQL